MDQPFMHPLVKILQIIGTSSFNDMAMTFLSGDEDYIAESLHQGEEITPSPHNYMEKLSNAGYTNDNFPWTEFRLYIRDTVILLEHQLICPIQN